MWWRAICSYCVSRLDRHVTYYSPHMLYITTTRFFLRLFIFLRFVYGYTCQNLLPFFYMVKTVGEFAPLLSSYFITPNGRYTNGETHCI